jgi:hypothetical protein
MTRQRNTNDLQKAQVRWLLRIHVDTFPATSVATTIHLRTNDDTSIKMYVQVWRLLRILVYNISGHIHEKIQHVQVWRPLRIPVYNISGRIQIKYSNINAVPKQQMGCETHYMTSIKYSTHRCGGRCASSSMTLPDTSVMVRA